MNLKTEQYKGRNLRFVEKVLSGKKWVVGSAYLQGKTVEVTGLTKLEVLPKLKKLLDYKLPKVTK